MGADLRGDLLGAKGAVTIGLAAGPLSWSTMLLVNYALAKWSCGHGGPWVLNVVTGAALAVTLSGGLLAWRALETVRPEAPTDGVADADIQRFLALLALAMSGFFVFALIAASVPPVVFDACH
jgi:hypothetical protein